MKNKIIIVGAFHEIIELAEKKDFEIVGLIDNEKKVSYRNYKILCNDSDAKDFLKAITDLKLVISPDKPEQRKKLVSYYSELGFEFDALISNEAIISNSAIIGAGTVIQADVNVSAECNIGNFVKLNTKCNLMHDVIVCDYTTIAPNAVVLGKVKIGYSCYIGANSTILPGINIGDHAIIGAGAVVTKNVDSNSTVAGVPAKEILK